MRWAVMLTLIGCSSGIPFEDYLPEQRDATCGYYVRCGAVASVGECREYQKRFETANRSLTAAVSAGKIDYHSDAAQDCIDAYDTLDCDFADQPPDALAACSDVFTGTLDVGETCAFDRECKSDRCLPPPNCTDACCYGTCEPPRVYPGLGEPCLTVCDGDLFCNLDQICQAPAGYGEPCGNAICAEPYYCSINADNTCVDRPGLGEPCEGGNCASEGLVCGPSASCVQAALGGDACSTLNDCSRFYFCNFDTQKCELPPATPGFANGENCSFSTQCSSRYCGPDMKCAEQPACF